MALCALVVFVLITKLYADSSRLLLQTSCVNCGSTCVPCIEGRCSPIPGCCLTNNDCNGNLICTAQQCKEQVMIPWQWPSSCPREFCNCPKNSDPVYCISGHIYLNNCAADCNCELNCFKICKSDSECNINFSHGFCIDIPNDTCDPTNGGTNCDGYCRGPMMAIGRPYNVNNQLTDLKAEFEYIDCTDYKYYFPDIQSISINNSVNDELINSWIHKALSEHAAIATFAKFNLDLMSISAPLWFLQTSNRASFDEIQHAKMSFDILNAFIMNMNRNNNSDNKCITFNKFPTHSLEIDADYNRISLDAAIGGCFGETLSAFKTYFDDGVDVLLMEQYLYEIGMDEIRHSSLAWVAVKWIIDQKGYEIQVSDIQWWKRELLQRKFNLNNDKGISNYAARMEKYVYEEVIPSILNLLWAAGSGWIEITDYSVLYNEIGQLMENHFSIYSRKVSNDIDLISKNSLWNVKHKNNIFYLSLESMRVSF